MLWARFEAERIEPRSEISGRLQVAMLDALKYEFKDYGYNYVNFLQRLKKIIQ